MNELMVKVGPSEDFNMVPIRTSISYIQNEYR